MFDLNSIIRNAGFEVSSVEKVGYTSISDIPFVYSDFLESRKFKDYFSDVKYSSEEEENCVKDLNSRIQDILSNSNKVTEEYLNSHYFNADTKLEEARVNKLIRDFIIKNKAIFRLSSAPVGNIFVYDRLDLRFYIGRHLYRGITDQYTNAFVYRMNAYDATKFLLSLIQQDIDSGNIRLLTLEPDDNFKGLHIGLEMEYYGYCIKQDKRTMELLKDWLSQGCIIKDRNKYMLRYGKKVINGYTTGEKWYYLKRCEEY